MDNKGEYMAPGVYVEGLPSGVQPISGVPTAVAAFVGRAMRGPLNEPTAVSSFTDFVRVFGKLDLDLPLTAAVQDFFNNGGRRALIVRVWNGKDGGELAPVHAGESLTLVKHFTGSAQDQSGMYALLKGEKFNLLCIPPDGRAQSERADIPDDVWREAAYFCMKQHALLIVDPRLAWGADHKTAVARVKAGWQALGVQGPEWRNAALYFPRVIRKYLSGQERDGISAPCGIVAGIIARTDMDSGVWKAPAGLKAGIRGINRLQLNLTDSDQDELNQLGINCLRNFTAHGDVVWGARTLRGAEIFADEYKYIPVRRMAHYLEDSIFAATQWAVFEPNAANLWARLRASVESFLFDLFKAGAFAGQTAQEAFFVRCDQSTMTQNDIDNGLVHVLVGFAPLKPAEFNLFRIVYKLVQ